MWTHTGFDRTIGEVANETRSNVRRNIQNAIEHQEEERRKKLLQQRLDIARQGVAAYQKKRIGDAVRCFHAYLRILEELKDVGDGGLLPKHFDPGKDLPELLVLSGVYWDLVKLYDRTQSADKHREFLQYLEKYVVFARGMSYQTLCAETMRKYISNEKPIHKEEFKNAYRMLAGSKCFIATSLIDLTDEETLPRLRTFRDQSLRRSAMGRVFIQAYYRVGPVAASVLDQSPDRFRRVVAHGLDTLARLISRA